MRSTGRCASAACGSGRRGIAPAADALVVVIDPGRAFGTGSHQTTQLCLAALQELEPRSLLDVGCGSGVLSVAAALLGFGPVTSVDVEEPSIEATRANAAVNGVDLDVRLRRARRPPAARGRRRREHLPRVRRGAPAAHRVHDARHLGLSRVRDSRAAGLRARRTPDARRLGVRRLPRDVTHTIPAVATFTVDFLGCKVSHVDAHEVREALLRDGHTEDAAADVAVISTCCVTNEAVAKSRKAAARAARTHARVYLTGCAANLGGTAFAGLPENVVVVAKRARGDCGVRRRRRRRDRLRAGRRARRPRARVREDPGRLLVLVQLLRHPARARCVAQP